MNIKDILSRDKRICTGCSSCYNACPVQAIQMERDKEGFLYPHIDGNICTECGLCYQICSHNYKPGPSSYKRVAYAMTIKDESVCMRSSSGGVFSLLANTTLKEHGEVYGATLDDDLLVKHIMVDSVNELYRLQGSKYMQSDLGKCYQSVKKSLDKKKKVLFSGTPCQIVGLKAFLKKDYDNLLTVDIICHGVPSPLVWKQYINEKQIQEKIQITQVNFRDKKYGWKQYGFSYIDDEGRYHYETRQKNLFMKGFLSDLYLRPSCYMCREKSFEKKSDITIADFWGVEKLYPSLVNERGVSLVTINTTKGEMAFFDSVSDEKCYSVDIDKAFRRNKAAIQSSKKNKNRDKFFSAYINAEDTMENLIKKYYRSYSVRKKCSLFIREKIKSMIAKIK